MLEKKNEVLEKQKCYKKNRNVGKKMKCWRNRYV